MKMDKPELELSNQDGNAFMLISRALRELKKWNRDNPDNQIDVDVFEEEATSGDYDHVIQTIMKTFNTY